MREKPKRQARDQRLSSISMHRLRAVVSQARIKELKAREHRRKDHEI
jgi:hypothetical protein